MKAARIYPLWWNPWGDRGLDFDKKVSISIDNLDHDKSADYKILFLAEPLAILPTVSEGALRCAYKFDKIYTFCQSFIDRYPQAELFEWGSSWLDFKDLKINKTNNVSFVTSAKSQSKGDDHQYWEPLKFVERDIVFPGDGGKDVHVPVPIPTRFTPNSQWVDCFELSIPAGKSVQTRGEHGVLNPCPDEPKIVPSSLPAELYIL